MEENRKKFAPVIDRIHFCSHFECTIFLTGRYEDARANKRMQDDDERETKWTNLLMGRQKQMQIQWANYD